MKMKILLLILCLNFLANNFQVNPQSPKNKQPTQNYTGNFSNTELTLLKQFIIQTQQLYQPSQLNKIAKYIYTKMQNATTMINMYNTHIFQPGIQEIGFAGWAILDKQLWWIGYGKFNLTYVVWVCNMCYTNGAAGSLSQFGQNITPTMAQKIKDLIHSSTIYKGDNVDTAADYIKTKLTNAIAAWEVLIAKPTKKQGFYDCRFHQWWAALEKYEYFEWSYYLIKIY